MYQVSGIRILAGEPMATIIDTQKRKARSTCTQSKLKK